MADPTYPFSQWRWRVTDELTKRRRTTRHYMTEEEARARYGDDVEKAPGTEMVVNKRSTDLGGWSQKK